MAGTLTLDHNHLLPDEQWGDVVRRANSLHQWTIDNAGGGAASGIAPVLDLTWAGVRSRKYFPAADKMATQLLVLHSAECPLRGGFAQSLTEWAVSIYPQAPIASWQRFVDPFVRLRFIPDNLGAWHASEANVNSIGWEQAGYARFTRAEWLTPDGLIQLESLAFDMAEVAVRDGIPARWLTDTEVVAATHGNNRAIKGFCTHRQIDPDTRTDPGDNYPYELLMDRIRFYMGNGGTLVPAGNTSEGDTDMATPTEVAQAILTYPFKLKGGGETNLLTQLQNLDENQVATLARTGQIQQYLELMNGKDDKRDELLAALPDAVLDEEITMPDGRTTTPRKEMAWIAANFAATQAAAAGREGA